MISIRFCCFYKKLGIQQFYKSFVNSHLPSVQNKMGNLIFISQLLMLSVVFTAVIGVVFFKAHTQNCVCMAFVELIYFNLLLT